jgi:hypothetical protein
MSEAGSPIAEAEQGGRQTRRRRLDGTILGVRRLGNLSVPFRLSPPVVGAGSFLNGFPLPGGHDWKPELPVFPTISGADGRL